MRSVNLIPPDERRGDRAPLRTGAFTYVLVGGLSLLLLLIAATALSSKHVSDRKAEKQNLEAELAADTARAESLAKFTDFRAVQESRAATVTSLADSRFDWSRVLHELSLVLPSEVQLTSVTGTVNPQVQLEDADQVPIRSTVPGPALEIVGCAPGQDAVAGFVASLEDIDGVTRVGLDSSELGASEPGAAGTADPTGTSDSGSCPVSPQIAEFRIVVAFDAVPTPPTATAAPSVPAPAAGGTGSAQVASAQQASASAGG